MAEKEKPAKLPSAYKPSAAPAMRPRRRTRRRKTALTVLLILLLAGAAGFFAYKYHQAQHKAELLANPKLAASEQIDDLVNKVGKLVVLPTGERPTVATVTDVSKLKGQVFFNPAQNGDKVLIYTHAKQAVLYRPSQNRVIEIAPLDIGSSSSSSSSNGTTTDNSTN